MYYNFASFEIPHPDSFRFFLNARYWLDLEILNLRLMKSRIFVTESQNLWYVTLQYKLQKCFVLRYIAYNF